MTISIYKYIYRYNIYMKQIYKYIYISVYFSFVSLFSTVKCVQNTNKGWFLTNMRRFFFLAFQSSNVLYTVHIVNFTIYTDQA